MPSTKRIFDVLFSLGAMIFFIPIGVVATFFIKATSPGPIFYSSKRVGKDGQPIYCWKFRTMHQDADKKLLEILRENPKLKQEWDTYFKLKEDPRVSTIGKILRKTSLDELPQFFNVLKGDLSVVGPRPVTEEEIQKYFGSKASKILSVRPGLTGIWQTSGRSLLTFEERIRLEESYIDRQSLTLDLRIICKTIPAMFFTKGAF
jgi:undecaprenyl-phosphate galactose phosphotransferase